MCSPCGPRYDLRGDYSTMVREERQPRSAHRETRRPKNSGTDSEFRGRGSNRPSDLRGTHADDRVVKLTRLMRNTILKMNTRAKNLAKRRREEERHSG